MTMTTQNKPPYNTVPHYIAKDYRSGKLKLNELHLLLWLRAIGDPYGVATTSLIDLRDDIFPDLKKNTVNSILLSLRKKLYVFYETRQGKTGTFDVHLDHWMTPHKGYKTLDKFFTTNEKEADEGDKSVDNESYPQANSPEVSQKLGGQNQKLLEQKNQLAEQLSTNSNNSQIRSYHNEHDTEHNLENHDTLEKNSFKGTLVGDFGANNREEGMCKEIAEEVGEEYINPLRDVLRKNGFWVIEKAWGLYREDKQNGKVIAKPAAYFYGIIKNLLKER